MAEDLVVIEQVGKVAKVTMRRTEKLNALNEAMWKGLREAADKLSADLPRAVVLTGSGRAFCAGMDVAPDNPQARDGGSGCPVQGSGTDARVPQGASASIDKLVGLPVPVIAAINCLAYGGGAELAVRCDLRTMERGAQICFSEVRLDSCPTWEGAWRSRGWWDPASRPTSS